MEEHGFKSFETDKVTSGIDFTFPLSSLNQYNLKDIYLEENRMIVNYGADNPLLAGVNVRDEFQYLLTSLYTSQRFLSSQERTERKLDNLATEIAKLNRDVARRDDIIEQTNILLSHQKKLNEELYEKWEILREMQSSNVAHKRLMRYSAVFLAFFSISFLSNTLFYTTIVTPFWNNLGLLLSFGFLMMSLALKKDWNEKTKMS